MSEEQELKEYVEFLRTVERTVFIGNLSPATTSSILKSGLSQFGDVISVDFIPNYTIPHQIPSCALVQMKTVKQAAAVVTEITDNPFMLFGKPRPITAMPSKADMFVDRPPIPDGEDKTVVVVKSSHPNVEVGRQMKMLCKKHTAETLMLIRQIKEEEEELAKKQAEVLKEYYRKYNAIEEIKRSGCIDGLARAYGLRLKGDY